MKITEVFRRDFIVGELRSTEKEDVLTELSSVFPCENFHCNVEAMVKVLMEREKLGSTGVGESIAIPHGKIQGLDDLHISFGRSRKGVAFDALDGKPVHLFFLLMAPDHSAGQHLKALAKISRMLKDTDFRKKLMNAKTRDDLYNVIREKDEAS